MTVKKASLNSVYHSLLIFILPLVLTIVFFGRLFVPDPSLFMIPDFGESDVLHLNLPLKKILSDALLAKRWPLWSSSISSGFPMLAEGQVGTFFLPNLLIFRFFPFEAAYNLGLLSAYLIAFFGSYLLFSRLGFTRIVASFCATIFTYSGFFTVHLGHYNLLQTAVMLPLVFWAAIAVYRKPSILNSVVFAFLFSQQIFAGFLGMVMVTIVAVSLWWAARLIIDRFPLNTSIKKCVIFILAIFLSLGFSAVQMVPTLELWQRSFRSTGLSFATVTEYPYPPRHLITFLFPDFFGTPIDGSYPRFDQSWGIYWENTAYIGLLPCVLAVVGAFVGLKKLKYIPFSILLVFSLLLVTGKYSPLYLLYSLPPFSLFRVPSRYLLITLMSLTVLLGFIMTNIFNYIKAQTKIKTFISYILLGILYLAFIMDGFAFSYRYPPVSSFSKWLEPPEIANLLPAGSLVTSIGSQQQWNEVFLTKGWSDITPYYFLKNNLYPKSASLFGLKNFDFATGGINPKRQGYFSSIGRQAQFNDLTNSAIIPAPATNILALSATSFITSPYQLKGLGLEEIHSEPDLSGRFDPIRLYRLNSARTSAYHAFNSQPITTLEEITNILSDPKFLESASVLVEKNTLVMSSSQKEILPAAIVRQDATSIVIETDAPENSLLVITDNNYPGWVADIDGKATPVEYVNLTQKGIQVMAGKHKVTFSFKPNSFQIGKIISIFTGGVMFVLIIKSRLKYKK